MIFFDGLRWRFYYLKMVMLHSKRNCEITRREHTLLDSCFLIGSSTIQNFLLLKTNRGWDNGWDSVAVVSLDVTGHPGHPKRDPSITKKRSCYNYSLKK